MHEQIIETVANEILVSNLNAVKPNYSNRHFYNTIIIFMNVLMDKMISLQESESMSIEDKINMAEACGNDLRKLIHTYTNLDTHDLDSIL